MIIIDHDRAEKKVIYLYKKEGGGREREEKNW